MKPDNLSGSKSSSACCAGTRRQRAKRRSADVVGVAVAVNPRRANFSGVAGWGAMEGGLRSGVSSYGNLGAVFRPSSSNSATVRKGMKNVVVVVVVAC